MESIKNELIHLGVDPSCLSVSDLLRLETICEAPDEYLNAFLQDKTALEQAHNVLVGELERLTKDTKELLLALSKIPSTPTRGFGDSCALMLAEISKAKEETLATLLVTLAKLDEMYQQGNQKRIDLTKELSVLSLAMQIRKTATSPCDRIDLHAPFGYSVETLLVKLSKILKDCETFLSDLALSTARLAKKVDRKEATPNEYGRLIEGAQIRLHDLGVAASHREKEIDHVKIHTCP